MSKEILAYFITWTTYGTWMPGDWRGWRRKEVDRKCLIGPKLYSDGLLAPQPLLAEWCRDNMKGDAVKLSTSDRATVQRAIEEHCQYRDWKLLASNPRQTHVHVVIHANAKPKTVRDQLKANCTATVEVTNQAINH